MVKVRRLYIENFQILKLVLGRDNLELQFSDNPICIIIGKNGSGKSFLMSLISPSPVDLVKNRSGNPSIPNKTGIKELDLELNGKYLYKIRIVYDSKTSCFIHKYNMYTNEDLGELNPNGNVNSYYDVLDKELGFTKSYLNIGYLSNNVTDIITMKPAERSSYISVWLPQLSEFIDSFKIVSKKSNIIKRQIDMLNEDIGKLNDTDYDLLIATYTKNISELETEYHTYLDYQSKTQAYLKLLKHINRDDVIGKIKDFTQKAQLLNQERIHILDEQDILAKYSGKKGKKLLEDTIKQCGTEIIKLGEKISRIDSDLTIIESELNEIKAEDTELDENSFLNIESTINSLKEELTISNNLKDKIIKENTSYNKTDILSKSEIDIFKSFLEDLNDMRNKVTSLVDSSYLKDNEFVSRSSDQIAKLKDVYEANLDKIEADILKVTNKIYLLKNSNLNYLLELRPSACKMVCGIIDEILKYTNPKVEIEKNQKELNTLIASKTDINNKLLDIKEKSLHMAMAISIIDEMNHRIIHRKDIIAKMPLFVRSVFENPDIGVLIQEIPILLDTFDDYKEFIYLIEKIRVLKQSLDNTLVTYNLLKHKKNINEKWLKLHEKFEKMSSERRFLIDEFNKNENLEKRLNQLHILSEQNNERIKEYNDRADLLLHEQNLLRKYAQNYYLFHSLTEADNNLEIKIYQIKHNLDEAKSKIEAIKTKKNSMITLIESRDSLLKKKKRYDILSDVWSPKVGYPALQMEEWLDELTVQTNNDLEKMWGSDLKIETFIIGANEFSIPVNRSGTIIRDASECSEGERATLSLAISFAVIEINLKHRKYNVLRFDELDGPFDIDRRKGFISILDKRLPDLDCGTACVVSHNNEFGDISADVILLSKTEEQNDLINKNIIFSVGG